MTLAAVDFVSMLRAATPTPSFSRDHLDQLKASLPLEWVVLRSGVPVTAEGDRLRGDCPFHGGAGDFAVYSLPDDDVLLTRVGCWSDACPFEDGDLFTFLMHCDGGSFTAAVRAAEGLLAEFRAAGPWTATPVAPAVRADPADLAQRALSAQQLAASNRDAIVRLIDEKLHVRGELGWSSVTPEFLVSQWGVGVESGWEVVVPHLGADGSVRGLKTRTARSHLIAARGSELCALYGEHRDRGHRRVLLVEGESDAWCASALLADQDVDVLGLPSGAHARPKQPWLDRLRDRDVVIAFDGDATGEHAAQRWALALTGIAHDVRQLEFADGEDFASCPPDGLLLDWPAEVAALKQPAAGTTERRWMEFPADDAAVSPLVEVVEGLIVSGSNGLAGYPKTGKSLIATGLGKAIAGGMTTYLGRTVKLHGDVLHVYLEGTRGLPGRVRAFDTTYAEELPSPDAQPGRYRIWPHPVDLRRSEDVEELLNSLPASSAPPVLLILDTLAASFPGLRGNEEDEKVLAYLRFEELIARTGATAGLMVSHTGHADRGREMGSVAGIGRLDNALVAVRDEKSGQRALKVSMARDLDDSSSDAEVPYRVEGVPDCAWDETGALTRSGPVVIAGHASTDWGSVMANAASVVPTVLDLVRPVLSAPGYAESPLSKKALYNAVADPRRPRYQDFGNAVDTLAAQGLLDVVDGPRGAKLVTLRAEAVPDPATAERPAADPDGASS